MNSTRAAHSGEPAPSRDVPPPLITFCTKAIVNAGWRFRKLGKGSKEPPSGVPVEDSGDLETLLGWINEGHQPGLLLGEDDIVHLDFEKSAMELVGDADFGPALRWRSQSGGLAVIASREFVERRFGPDVLKGERYVTRTAEGELVPRKPKKDAGEVLLLEIRSARGKYVLVPGCSGPLGEYVLLNGEPASAVRLPDPDFSEAALDLLVLASSRCAPEAAKLPQLSTISALHAHVLESGEHGRHNALFEAAACGANLVARGQLDEQETLAALHDAGSRRAQLSVERGELLFRTEEVDQTIQSVWRLSKALAARRNGHAAPAPPIPVKRETASPEDALALLEEAKTAGDPSLLFKNVDALADLSRADESIFLLEVKKAFDCKADLARAIQERRKAKRDEAKKQATASAKAERQRRRSRATEELRSSASTTKRREIQLHDGDVTRDPIVIHHEAVASLVARNAPEHLFLRGRRPARIGVDEEGQPEIERIKDKEMQSELIRSAIFIGHNVSGLPQPVDPPVATIRTLLGCGDLPFPRLAGIVRGPVVRRDGTILMQQGYDKATGLYYQADSGLIIPIVPSTPTKEEIIKARGLILEVYCQFPFVTEASRANSVALMLTSFLQPVVDDHRPLCAISAFQPGSGKGEIAGASSRICTGRPPRMTRLRREEEFEKKLAHLMFVGTPFICIDNAKGRLESETLESTLTIRRFSERRLGRNDDGFEVPQDATWCATGNNLELGTEMARRSYLVELDPKDPHPEDREGPSPGETFKRLPTWVMEQRGQLIWAVLTLCRAWFAGGCPRPMLRAFGNFDPWQEVVGGVLEVAGIPEFLANRNQLRTEQDEERRQWSTFVRQIRTTLGGKPFTTRELRDRIVVTVALRDALPDELASLLGKENFVQELGQKLGKRKGTRMAEDGLRVVRLEDEGHEKVAQWQVLVGEEKPHGAA